MTKLTTHIPREYVLKNEKLQEIESKFKYYRFKNDGEYKAWNIMVNLDGRWDKKESFSAPTIADVIDNAEMLFGKTSEITRRNFRVNEYISKVILEKCQQDRSIEEISEYILKNIK